MSASSDANIAGAFSEAARMAGELVSGLLLAPGSGASLASFVAALCLATVLVLLNRARGKRLPRLRALFRALFPRGLRRHRSHWTDVGFFLFNTTVYGLLFGWAILSQELISGAALEGLTALFGAGPGPLVGPIAALVIGTPILFLAAELGFWIEHWLSHRVPFLWEFHKVHHSAEALSPLTNFRMHPVNGITYANVVGLTMGLTDAALTWGLGRPIQAFMVADANILALVALYTVQHLQHSHLWIIYPGRLGRLITSPAHHQIHHSTNPEHFGKNLGGVLLVWDRLFGTLHTPSPRRERLTFGLGPGESRHDSIREGLVMPVIRAFATLRRRPSRPAFGQT